MGFSLTKQKTRSVVGLDIESGFLAAAELGNGNGPVLRRAATEALHPGLFHEGEVTDADGLAEQLKHFFAQHKLPKRVRLGLASQRVALRVLELPLIEDAKELEAAVRFQAQEELPMPLEQAVLDHRVIERFTDGENPRMRVLVVGARRDSIERLLAATRKAGLVPEVVDLSAFAMIRALYVPPVLHSYDESHVDHHEDQAGQPPELTTEYVEPLTDHVEAPTDHFEPPFDHVDQPTDHVEAPTDDFEPPLDHVDHPSDHPDHPSDDLEPAAVEANGGEPGSVDDGDLTGEQTVPLEGPEVPADTTYDFDLATPDSGHENGHAEPIPSAHEIAGEHQFEPYEETVDPEAGGDTDTERAVIYCYVGGATNLAIAVGTSCVFNRVLPNGAESMAATLAERRGLTLDHARQWLRHVGLDRDLDTVEGEREIVQEARLVLDRGAARIADDVRLSLEYYQAAVSDARSVERMVMAGPGIALEGLPRAVEAQLGLPVVARSLGNVQVNPGALDGVDASQLTVAAGLALDEVGE